MPLAQETSRNACLSAQIRPWEKISERPFLESWLDNNSEIAPAILSPPATEGSMALA